LPLTGEQALLHRETEPEGADSDHADQADQADQADPQIRRSADPQITQISRSADPAQLSLLEFQGAGICRHWESSRMSTPSSSSTTSPVPAGATAIITGGSRGLGFEVARGLAAQGYQLALIAKDPQGLAQAREKLVAEFPQSSVATFAIDFEVTTPTALDRARQQLAEVRSSVATPTALVIAHAVMSEKMSKTLRTTDAEWRRVLAINLDSTFMVVNELVPPMADARAGRVVIFSACLGRMSGPGNAGGLAPYRISKAGVNALIRNLAHETGMGARGLLVDAICPNHSRTDMGGPDALRSAEEGAETALWLLNRSFNHQSENEIERTTGVLWEDHQIVPW
jgi:NAD(P)-dependent dehydrogenase (short-subunit alcohol dehydrogenase family)